ncbi:hypothetical protein B0H66DRAFT_565731 [Apodospora peruviana]|uniref:Uncharacterized protein n=1 Tax=Apodospora peruviana TaxID=516989 RepID=A0AAE0HZI2_9PEZI|nr:hypothetical protein B0H66DRAFT_565731 [Apodospora peruviana]
MMSARHIVNPSSFLLIISILSGSVCWVAVKPPGRLFRHSYQGCTSLSGPCQAPFCQPRARREDHLEHLRYV